MHWSSSGKWEITDEFTRYAKLKKRNNSGHVNKVIKITCELPFVGLFCLMVFSIYLCSKYRYYAIKFLRKVIQRS